jgi:acyl-CoA synthetase (NDP forming)
VAVVGASADTAKWGGDVAARLVRQTAERRVYLVNRRGGTIQGATAYPSFRDLPEAPELAILAMPAAALDSVLDEALDAGTRAFIGVFAGLGEAGREGMARERAAVARVRRAGGLFLGPNCMGLTDHTTGFQAVAYLDVPPGDIGFVSQSGAMGEEIVSRARAYGCGFSRYITLGNQADVGIAEVMRTFAGDGRTRAVALYAEGFQEGRDAARAVAAVVASGVPVVLLAPGRSAAGVRAARSHTGSLAPAPVVLDAVCRATGALRADTPRELFELTLALSCAPPARGRRIAVVTEGGGHGGVAADALAAAGLEVPRFGDASLARVREALPASSGANPIDFAVGTTEPDAYARVLPVVASSDETDAVLAVGQLGYWAERFPQFTELVRAEVDGAAAMARAARRSGRPLVVSTVYPGSAPAAVLRAAGVPVYREIASAAAALAALAARAGAPASGVPQLPSPGALVQGPDYLEARELLADAGLPYPAARRAGTCEEAVTAACDIGFPVVLKALGLLHKSDAGGVALGLGDEAGVAEAWREMCERLRPPGVVVECEVERAGVELLIGCRQDPSFGTVALVGLGGVYAEVLRDVCAALAPVTAEQARTMLDGLRGAPLLHGARGRPALDADAAARALADLSRFAAAHPEVAEVEVNPLLVSARGVVALDARIVLCADDEDRPAAGQADRGG